MDESVNVSVPVGQMEEEQLDDSMNKDLRGSHLVEGRM
jgi:hypothetical protein